MLSLLLGPAAPSQQLVALLPFVGWKHIWGNSLGQREPRYGFARGSKAPVGCWRSWRPAGAPKGAEIGVGGQERTLTLGLPSFPNISKQEATAGPNLPKESHTLEKMRRLGNVLLRNKKRNQSFRELLVVGLFLTKGQVFRGPPKRKIQERKNSIVSKVQIPVFPFLVWGPG